MDAYSLAFTATLLASGALADRYGRRRALLAGNALFAVALARPAGWPGTAQPVGRARCPGLGAAFVDHRLDRVDRQRLSRSGGPRAGVRPRGHRLGRGDGDRPDPGRRSRRPGSAGAGSSSPTFPSVSWPLGSCRGSSPEERAADSRPLDPVGIALLTLALGIAIETLLAGRTATHIALGTGASLACADSVRRAAETPAAAGPRSRAADQARHDRRLVAADHRVDRLLGGAGLSAAVPDDGLRPLHRAGRRRDPRRDACRWSSCRPSPAAWPRAGDGVPSSPAGSRRSPPATSPGAEPDLDDGAPRHGRDRNGHRRSCSRSSRAPSSPWRRRRKPAWPRRSPS